MESKLTGSTIGGVTRESLDWRTLHIKRVIVHQLFKHPPGGDPITPTLSTRLAALAPEAITELEDRITMALGENAASLPIGFEDKTNAAVYKEALAAHSAEHDPMFIKASHELGRLLAEAQEQRNPPGGILLVIQATIKQGIRQAGHVEPEDCAGLAGSFNTGCRAEVLRASG